MYERFKDPGLTEKQAQAVLLQMEKNLQIRKYNLNAPVGWFLKASFNRNTIARTGEGTPLPCFFPDGGARAGRG